MIPRSLFRGPASLGLGDPLMPPLLLQPLQYPQRPSPWLMPGDAEHSWLGLASAHHQRGGFHGLGGLARSPAFSCRRRWGFYNSGAAARVGGDTGGEVGGHVSRHTHGGHWGGRWHCGHKLCRRYDSSVGHLGSLANPNTWYTSSGPRCPLITSGRSSTNSGGVKTRSIYFYAI